MNRTVAVLMDMEFILAEINPTRPICAKKTKNKVTPLEYNNSKACGLFATHKDVRPEIANAKVIQRYTFFNTAKCIVCTEFLTYSEAFKALVILFISYIIITIVVNYCFRILLLK